MPDLARSGRNEAAPGYSVSLLQAAAALYGADVARELSGRRPTSKSQKKSRE